MLLGTWRFFVRTVAVSVKSVCVAASERCWHCTWGAVRRRCASFAFAFDEGSCMVTLTGCVLEYCRKQVRLLSGSSACGVLVMSRFDTAVLDGRCSAIEDSQERKILGSPCHLQGQVFLVDR
jgi:hypothetical protein